MILFFGIKTIKEAKSILKERFKITKVRNKLDGESRKEYIEYLTEIIMYEEEKHFQLFLDQVFGKVKKKY